MEQMMSSKFWALGTTTAALVLGLGIGASHAFDLPVTYWVDGKTLKREAVAGTPLTFELHADPTCSSLTFVYTMDIDTVSFGIEKLKLQKIKGGEKPPKPMRINAVLLDAVPGAEQYLKVIGVGIVPVNGECQVQISGVPGPAGTPGTDGTDGANGLNCWDLNDNGICDIGSEDINGGGSCDVVDCIGQQGPPGTSANFGSCVRREAVIPAGMNTGTAMCNAGETAVGGGNSGATAIALSFPNANLSGWTVTTNGTGGGTIYAVCCQ